MFKKEVGWGDWGGGGCGGKGKREGRGQDLNHDGPGPQGHNNYPNRQVTFPQWKKSIRRENVKHFLANFITEQRKYFHSFFATVEKQLDEFRFLGIKILEMCIFSPQRRRQAYKTRFVSEV